jgi:hypothetical protein
MPRAKIVIVALMACLSPLFQAGASAATLTISFTNNGEPLEEPTCGKFYVYEVDKREKYLDWGHAGRPARVPDGSYDIVVLYRNDEIRQEKVIEEIELEGEVELEMGFTIQVAQLTLHATSGGEPLPPGTGRYRLHKAGTRGKPLAARRPGRSMTVRAGRYDIEISYRGRRGLQTKWLENYHLTGVREETVEMGARRRLDGGEPSGGSVADASSAAPRAASAARPASLRVLPGEGSKRRRGISETNILIVLDSSAEMEGRLGVRSRMEAVRSLLSESLSSLATGGVKVGLRVHGVAPRARRDCTDSTLLVSMGRADRRAMRRTIEHLRPTGYSPIAHSLEQAGSDLPDGGNNAIILITGGADSCGGDACSAAAALLRAGEATRLYVLALGVEPSVENSLQCIGEYGAVETAADLKSGLREVYRSALRLDLGTVSIFEAGGGKWVASGTLRERLVVPAGRYDVKIVDGSQSWLWEGVEITGEMEATAGPRPTP